MGGSGLAPYDKATLPMQMRGNVFLRGATAGQAEPNARIDRESDPGIQLTQQADGVYLRIALNKAWAEEASCQLVTTENLGRARVSGLPYEQPNASPHRLDTDYFGKRRHPVPRPLRDQGERRASLGSLAVGTLSGGSGPWLSQFSRRARRRDRTVDSMGRTAER